MLNMLKSVHWATPYVRARSRFETVFVVFTNQNEIQYTQMVWPNGHILTYSTFFILMF
jgi:hypothetical protein